MLWRSNGGVTDVRCGTVLVTLTTPGTVLSGPEFADDVL
jgi:hypothetical protein